MIVIEWEYANNDGGAFEVDPSEFAGMTKSMVKEELLRRSDQEAMRNVLSYVLDFNSVVDDIMEANGDDR